MLDGKSVQAHFGARGLGVAAANADAANPPRSGGGIDTSELSVPKRPANRVVTIGAGCCAMGLKLSAVAILLGERDGEVDNQGGHRERPRTLRRGRGKVDG